MLTHYHHQLNLMESKIIPQLLNAMGFSVSTISIVTDWGTWRSVILFILSVAYFGVRIYSYFLDIQKKKAENKAYISKLNKEAV